MVDLVREKLLDVKGVAVLCNVSTKTVYEWFNGKVGGRHLESSKIGGKRVTTLEAVQRFSCPSEPFKPIRNVKENKRIAEAKRVLAEHGL